MGDDPKEDPTLEERLLDALVFGPAGLVLSTLDDLPRYAALGRDRLGSRWRSARAVGQFTVTVGRQEIERRTASLWSRTPSGEETGAGAHDAPTPARRPARPAPAPVVPPAGANGTGGPPPVVRPVTDPGGPSGPATDGVGRAASPPSVASTTPTANGAPVVRTTTVPVESLAIHGFDTRSASQVVQRLDGLTRSELIALRSYETAGRGRRTILSRVDQLLDERS